MLQSHLTCIKQVEKLPRQILKKDKTVKFDKNYSGLFKKNYEVFGSNLYLEENLSKTISNNKIKQAKQKLFKKYGEESKQYLRANLFENPCIIKSEECKYLDTSNCVTIYYDQLTDLFAIVDSKSNCLLDFGIAGTLKTSEICLSPNKQLEEYSSVNQITKSTKSKEPEVYKEKYILSYIGSKIWLTFYSVDNSEFKIQDWQATKKLEHAVCFGINPAAYDFSQDQAKEINAKGRIVAYLQKGNKLPSLDLTRAYQNAIKNFCEDRNQSDRNDESTFRGEPSITFFNKKTNQPHIHILSRRAVKDFRKLENEFNIVFQKYKYKYLFGKDKPIIAKSLIRIINKDLKHTSELAGLPYTIKSHRFRINVISNLLKHTTVQNASDVIGHNDIRSTLSYRRYALSRTEIRYLLDKILY
jgi:hypothetical protein